MMSKLPNQGSTPEFTGAFAGQVRYLATTPPREAVFGPPVAGLSPRLAEKLPTRLYAHQSQAISAALGGQDVLVTTGTNSGKSLCLQVPAIHALMREPMARALFIMPTKALAQDQIRRLETLSEGLDLRVASYDGDTPKSHRSSIRKAANMIVTNPDMLHLGIVSGHDQWTKFLKRLRVIAIDELHAYRGVFGSHTALILRRLLRLCRWYGVRPLIVAGSASIENPEAHFEKLTGRLPVVIDEDGSPSGPRTVAFLSPPPLDSAAPPSQNLIASKAMATLIEHGHRCLTFSRSRMGAELVLKSARTRLRDLEIGKLDAYRGGYTASERRSIEQRLRRGDLLGLSATNALELGIDIGGLSAVVINGYPGSVSSFWQQAGRAGRGTDPGLTVFVAGDNPLEQYLVHQPEHLTGQRTETVTIRPENRNLLRQHLLCAAHERPIALSELDQFPSGALEVAESLDQAGELRFQSGHFYYPSFDLPAPNVNIRGSGGEQVTLMAGEEVLGTMEVQRALSEAHEGAIYLHRGVSFIVNRLDLQTRIATMDRCEAKCFTQPQIQSVLTIHRNLAERGPARLAWGTVCERVVGYTKRPLDGSGGVESHPLSMPPYDFETVCVQIDLPKPSDPEALMDHGMNVHAAEHVLHSIAPIIAGCDRGDLGSVWYTVHPDTLAPAVILFDRTPGGVGIADSLFARFDEWIAAAERVISTCDCDQGCPRCIFHPGCEIRNEFLRKPGTRALLRGLKTAGAG